MDKQKVNGLVSVIVPVYNVEKYLSKCVESLIRQTYKKLEILLIDDGSTDSSGDICDNYQKEYEFIKVIHKRNGGLSSARNVGIDNATGEFICFVDSDDYVHSRFVEVLHSLSINNNSEIAVCDFKLVDWTEENTDDCELLSSEVQVRSGRYYIDQFYGANHNIIVIACNKLYKTELFDGVRYNVGKVHEDEATTIKLLYQAKRIAYVPVELYYYCSRSDSITRQQFSEKRLDIFDAFEERIIFYRANGETDWESRDYRCYLSGILDMYAYIDSLNDLDNKRELLAKLKKRYVKVRKCANKSEWSLVHKAFYWAATFFPGLYKCAKGRN